MLTLLADYISHLLDTELAGRDDEEYVKSEVCEISNDRRLHQTHQTILFTGTGYSASHQASSRHGQVARMAGIIQLCENHTRHHL
jgi:hypothetical protein